MATAPATCAAGQKLSVTHQTAIAGVVIPMTNVMTPLTAAQIFSTFKTDYCGNIIYENGNVSRILTEEGYITFSGTTPVYHYYLKDHQGNNRVVINQSGTVEQVNHYYPFGGLMGESTAGGVQPYKYNGKELDRMHGLDLFDYGARHYDAAISRWWGVDALAEKYYSISPYAYCANNPVKFIDPTGMSYDWVQDKENRIKWDQNATPDTEGYLGKTVYATNENGEFRYGDQYGNWHDSAPLGEVSAGGFQSSGSGPVISGMRNAAKGYDPGWIAGFNQFVDAGLTAINLTLTATTLATEAGSFGSGSRIRAALSTVDDATKGASQGFRSFSSFKRAMGPAGPGQAWHHIVEKTPGNLAKFGNQTIHNTGNLMKLPHGAGSIHARVSGYYSSIQPFTGGQTVRQWLSTQSYQSQYNFGIKTLKQFGWP